MRKRIIIALGVILALCLAFTTVVLATQATKQSDITYRSIKIVVNGTEIAPVDVNGTPTEPFILNSDGSTYLPVRAVGDALGLDVGWDNGTSTVILYSGSTPKYSHKVPAATNATKHVSLTYRNIRITLDGTFVKLVNAKGETVEPFIYNNSTYLPVRAVATALGCDIGWDGATSTVTITKKAPAPDLKITSEPKDVKTVVNGSAEFSVKVTGGVEPYSYEWQAYNKETSKWQPLNAVFDTDRATLKIDKVLSSMAGTQLRCVISDAGGKTAYTRTCTLTLGDKLAVTQQPSSITIGVGESVNLTTKVSGGTGNYSYDWQIYLGTGWESLYDMNQNCFTNPTKATVKVGAPENNALCFNKQVKCVITDGESTVETNVVYITKKEVVVPPLAVSKNPSSQSMVADGSTTLSAAATGGSGNYTYRWQIYRDSTWMYVSSISQNCLTNYNTSTLSVTSTAGKSSFFFGKPIRCEISDGTNTVYTNSATISLPPALSIKQQPISISLPATSKANLSVAATGGSGKYTYAWQIDMGGWTNIATLSQSYITNFNSPMITIDAFGNENAYFYGKQIRCAVSDGMDTVYSNAVTISLPLTIITQPASGKSLAVGSSTTLSVTAKGGNGPSTYTYHWYAVNPSGNVYDLWTTSNSEVTNPDRQTVNIKASSDTSFVFSWKFYCVVSDGKTSVKSNAVTFAKA